MANADTQGPDRSAAKRKRSLTYLYLLGLGFVALAIATAITRRPATKSNEIASAPQHYLYCPECELEMTCPPEFVQQGMSCPHCGAGRRMKVTTVSHSDGSGLHAVPNRWMLPLVFGVPVVVAVAVFLLERSSKRPAAAKQQMQVQVQAYLTCPRCGQRISSASYGPGATAVCPECAEHFKVPGEPAPRKKKYKPEVIREKRRGPRLPPGQKAEGRGDEGPAMTEP